MLEVSTVAFDVRIESEHTHHEVMLRLFSRSPAVRFRTLSPLTYQAGSYVRTIDEPAVWTGRLDRIRTDPVSVVVKDQEGGNHFLDSQPEVPTSHATTYFAFIPSSGVLLYRDTAEMPYTRMASYVSSALELAAHEGFYATCIVTPRTVERPLREWIDKFTAIQRVRVQFRHSQSPGNRAVDSVLEYLQADTMIETIQAPPDRDLNKAALVDTSIPIGQAIDHLNQAIKNGAADITGRIGGIRTKFSTKSPVERHVIEVEEDAWQMRSTFARFALWLSSLGVREQ